MKFAEGKISLLIHEVCFPKTCPGRTEVRVKFQSSEQHFDRPLRVPCVVEGGSEGTSNDDRERVQLHRRLQVRDRVLRSSHRRQIQPIPLMPCGIAWSEF